MARLGRVSLCVSLAVAVWPALGRAAPAAGRGEWPMWRRDGRLTGTQRLQGAIRKPRVAWTHDLRGWEGLVVARPGGGPTALTLAGDAPRNPAYWDKGQYAWGLGKPRYDLDGSGKAVALWERYNARIGKLLPDVTGLQKVEIVEGRLPYGEETNKGWVACLAYDRGADRPRVAWKAPAVQKTHRPYTALADVDGDGDLDVVHSDWGQLSAHDGQSGRLIAKVHWLDHRHRGVLVAQDIDGDRLPEFAVIGHFHMNVSVVGNDGKRFRVLWSRDYEPRIEVQDRIVRAPRGCLADLDGDGRVELAYSLIDLTKDKVWHVLVHDAVSGRVVADLAGRYLDDAVDLDGDGRPELFVSESAGLQLPAHRMLRVCGFERGRLRERWRGRGRLHQRFDGRMASHVCEQLPFHDAVCGDLDGDGRREWLVSRRDGAVERCASVGFESEGSVVERPLLVWPRDVAADVRAVADSDGDGRPEVLVRCRVSGGEPVLKAAAAGLELVSWQRVARRELVGPAVVADLEGRGRPTVLVPRGWDRVAALRVGTPGGGPKVVWDVPGRAMSLIYQHAHGGVAAADLDGDGRKEVLVAAEGPTTGGACLQALDAGGTVVWRHEFGQIQWAPTRGWGPGALRTWSVGRFRKGKGLDVYASAHLNCMHSGTSYLLDGRDGSRVWTRLCLKGRVKEMGGGHAAAADLDGDGLDEIAAGYCNYLFTLEGDSGGVRSAAHSARLFQPVLRGSWVNSTTPLPVDADGDGTLEMLVGRSRLVAALVDGAAKRVRWCRAHRSGSYSMPGLADVDGDGRLEVGGLARAKKGGSLWCVDLATGKSEWEMPLPSSQATDFASGDIDGDGLAEFLFASGSTLYAVNGGGGRPRVVWKLALPSACGPPILADVDADGRSEILVVTADGLLRCIDGE